MLSSGGSEFCELSFDDEFSALNTNINGTHYLLGAVKSLARDCRFYFAGSSEMFGQTNQVPQNEDTAFTRARRTESARLRATI